VQPLVSRTVFDSISEQIIIINTESYTIIDANRAVLNQLKLKREEVIGKSCYEVTHKRASRCVAPDDLCPIGEMLKAGKPITVEHTHYDADCKPFYVEVSAYPIKDSDGKINYAIHIAKDITERKRLEKELVKFRSGVERAGEIVFITELDGEIVYVNPMFEQVYGYTKDEVLGKTPRILKSGILPDDIYKQFWSTLLANQTVSGEIINKTKDNRLLTIESCSNPISDKDGILVGFLAIQRDITERKKNEEALRESETRLNMAQRIAKLGSWEYYVNEDKAIWSEELFRIFGLKPQPYGPNINSYINLIHPEDRQKFLQEVQQLKPKSG
jgi:PAS domain S-box-containing protein